MDGVQERRQALIAALPFTQEIALTDDYADNADFLDHRQKLTNDYINTLQNTNFLKNFLPDNENNIQGRRILYALIKKEIPSVSSAYNQIRKAVETSFMRLQHVLENLPFGAHFWAEQVMRMTSDEAASSAMRALEEHSAKEYCKHWGNMGMMVARLYQGSREKDSQRFRLFKNASLLKRDQEDQLERLLLEANKVDLSENRM